MAYCLRSLVHILEQVMFPEKHYKHWVLDHAKIPQIRSLLEYATSLRDFFDNTSPLILNKIESLEDQIMKAAGKAEDAIETHITDQILLNLESQSFKLSPPDLGDVLQTFEEAKQELIKVKDADQRWGGVSAPVPSTRYPDSKNMVVGMTEGLNQLRSRLNTRAPELNIIPIVGMGGSGKTTLARTIYDEHSSTTSYFDCCAWVTVSQSYDTKEILQKLVDSIGKPLSGLPQQETDDLIVRLYKTLCKRRYLIVLDDIWSSQAWNNFQRAFPENNNRSRIILTTRDSTLAKLVNPNIHQINKLSDDDSWRLLSGKVFGQNTCPGDLEEVGKRIAWKCGGLPLALQVIAGILSQPEKNNDFWEHVASNVCSLVAEANDHSGIFSLSFDILPHYLKPCFLYMGAFPEDFAIPSLLITQMCIAEGFLYPVPGKSLEEAVEIHMNALVDRNLIFVRKRGSNGKAKSYGIHDLLRNLCLMKAREKKFIYFKDSKTDILPEDMLRLRRVCVHLSGDEKDEFGSLKLTSLARSFILIGDKASNRFVSRLCFKSSLLRVLNDSASTISVFDKVFLRLVNLRYLSLWFGKGTQLLSTNISMLRNLQTLGVNYLESIKILEDLPQLRHLRFRNLEQKSYEKPFNVHENLQSLSFIPLETLTGLLGKLPNLIKLETDGHNSKDNVDFTCFPKLESLYIRNAYKPRFPNETKFPQSIKHLRIRAYKIAQTVMDAIGVLPCLEILKLDNTDFDNNTWVPSQGGFCQLQYLEIKNSFIKNWPATEFDFPVLRHLIFDNCRDLIEIPIVIGGIDTLEIIEVDNCKTCVMESARRIRDEQKEEFGNTLFQLRDRCSLEEEERKDEEDEIKSMVTTNNALVLLSYVFRSTTVLPQTLKRLKLYICVLSQRDLLSIGFLPQLEFLKLATCEFESSTWEAVQGGFGKLQCLKIRGVKLKNWVATEIQYPVLRRLVLKRCHGLDEIPNRLGRIETLESLELDNCYPHLFDSAKKILEEQRQLRNNLLQLRLRTVLKYNVAA